MKHMRGITVVLLLFVITATAFGQQSPESGDKTLSPYFLVKSDDPGAVEQFPLKSTAATVGIAGVVADVRVTQLYENKGQQTIEALYVFPASARASVYGMKMTIGERTIVAKIRERKQAREDYEQARQEGRSASLLEQQRPNVFQMNVANILPGDLIKVELSYTELLVPESGTYEFVYPTVVGPRYSDLSRSGAPGSEKWVENPYLQEGEAPTYTFDISAAISGSMKIRKISCNTHKTDISYDSPSLARVKLDPSEKFGGNKDFILRYRLSGGQVDSGLLLYEGENENFFLLMLQPPKEVEEAQIPPREYVFIVDVSGSMNGFPLEVSKTLLRNLIGNLRADDKFNVLLFAGGSRFLSEQSLAATPRNIKQAIQVLDYQRGGGGTQLLPALERALAMRGTEGYSRSMVIVTDGYVRVEKEAFDLIRGKLGEANVFSFGIGSSVNRYLIEGLARVGMGEPFVITKQADAPARAEKFREYIQSPVLTRAKADFEGFEVYDVEPPGIPDVLAERPVVVFGKWKGSPKGKIRLSGLSGDRKYEKTLNVADFRPLEANAALPYLWARHKIALLSDYGKISGSGGVKKEITQLGLKYSLLTAHTSFVAIDSLIRTDGSNTSTVSQPLPLPEGVSDAAIGGAKQMMTRGITTKRPKLRSVEMSLPAAKLSEPEKDGMREEKTISLADKEDRKDETFSGGSVEILPAKKVVVSGALSEKEVRQMIQQAMKELERCYNSALEKTPRIKGKAVLKISVDATGQVSNAEFVSEDLASEDLKACITALARQWQFPIPPDGKAVSVEYSLAFNLK